MNNSLSVLQMKWQLQKVEQHKLVCQNQMCPHFQSTSVFSVSCIPKAQELLAGPGVFWGSQGLGEMNGGCAEEAGTAETFV